MAKSSDNTHTTAKQRRFSERQQSMLDHIEDYDLFHKMCINLENYKTDHIPLLYLAFVLKERK